MAKPIQNLNQDSFLDDKFLAKILSKEKCNTKNQAGETSFRVSYYGGVTRSVPFRWESQPGTPKHHTFHDKLLQSPLTPPPSYQFSPQRNSVTSKNNSRNSKFLNSFFPTKKIIVSPTSSSSSSSFSSSYSLPSSPFNVNKSYKARSNSAVPFRLEEDENRDGTSSPTSTLCFGPRHGKISLRRSCKGNFYPVKSVKKLVMSIVGHCKGN